MGCLGLVGVVLGIIEKPALTAESAGVGVYLGIGVGGFDLGSLLRVEQRGVARGGGGTGSGCIHINGGRTMGGGALQGGGDRYRGNYGHASTSRSFGFFFKFVRKRSRIAECIWLTRLSERSSVAPISFMVMPSK